MKFCDYCGQENDDAATVCAECGTNEFKPAISSPASQNPVEHQSGIWFKDTLADLPRLFRALVLVSTGSYCIWFFQLLLGGRFMARPTWDALAWEGYGALLPMPSAFSWLFLLLNLAVAVGLWQFSKSARLVFAALSVFFIIVSLLSGIHVQTAFGSCLLLIGDMADGALLVLAYTPPMRGRFR